jgi:hypothetical protein
MDYWNILEVIFVIEILKSVVDNFVMKNTSNYDLNNGIKENKSTYSQ